jgi:DNA-binding transcriptional regulator LsrR (DeoR family)
MADTNQGTVNETRLLSDERFLRRIAYAYYEDGHSQETIADKEYCSRQTVSKALQKAKDKGIVRISIVPDLRTGYIRNLSRDVRLQLGLEDLQLVPGQNMNAVPANEHLDDVVTEITILAADYLDQLLGDNDVVAVSGGSVFMRGVVRHLKPNKSYSHMQVVATTGFVQGRTSYGDANMISHDLAQAYGASHNWFPCPAILPDKARVEQTRELPIIKQSYEMMMQANVIVTGLWTPHTNDDMIMRGILTPEQTAAIEKYQPAVDINHWVFDAYGRCINDMMDIFPYALTGMEIPRLKDDIRERKIKVILVAGGGPSDVSAIRATLRAGLANILITDHITAQLLLTDS